MNSLYIKNYKNTESLQIDKLGRVNLIAGENNVGKSSLLEAVSILQSGGSLEWLMQLLEFRGESTDRYVENHQRKELDSFCPLFLITIMSINLSFLLCYQIWNVRWKYDLCILRRCR